LKTITLTDYAGSDATGVADLSAGKIAAYDFSLSPSENQQLGSSFSRVGTPSAVYDLMINPTNTTGSFNPFYYEPVRQALNYIVQRDYFVNNILGGLGIEALSPYAGEPDTLVVSNVTAQDQAFLQDSITLANQTIYPTLTAAGAYLLNGVWYYNKLPVVVYPFIRTDDPIRNEYGSFLSSQLQKLGFTVNQVTGDLSKEISVVYGANPANDSTPWSILPESWGAPYGYYDEGLAGGLGTTVDGYSAWTGNFLAMGTFNTTAQQQPLLTAQAKQDDTVGFNLITGNFSSLAQRDALLQQLVSLGINMSTRIWIATGLAPYVYNPSLVSGVTANFVQDPILNFISYLTMTSSSGSVTIGARHISEGAINPIAGDTDAYSASLWAGLSMPNFYQQGSTGYDFPIGVNLQVVSANPTPTVAVPTGTGGAIVYNATAGAFKAVTAGTMSKLDVIANFGPTMSNTKWSDGQPLTMDDLLEQIMMLGATATSGSADTFVPSSTTSVFDSTAGAVYAPDLGVDVAFKVLNSTSLEFYSNFYYPDTNFAALTAMSDFFPLGYAINAGNMVPWGLYEAMAQQVATGKAAWSSATAGSTGLPWLSLGGGQQAADTSGIASELTSLGSYVPPQFAQVTALTGVDVTPSAADASGNYSAANSFYSTNGNLMISDGPYYVSSWSTVAPATLVMKPNPSFAATSVIPSQMFAPSSTTSVSTSNVPAHLMAGQSVSVTALSTVLGSTTSTPSAGINVTVQFWGATGDVAQVRGVSGSGGTFTFSVPTVPAGSYTMVVYGYSSSSTLVNPTKTSVLVLSPTTSSSSTGSSSSSSSSSSSGTGVATTTTSSSGGISTGTLELIAGVVIVIIVIAAIGIVLTRRRPAPTTSSTTTTTTTTPPP
jgi:peptide/nickel transport system substrate-binding protein